MKRYKVVSVIDSLFNAPFGQSFPLLPRSQLPPLFHQNVQTQNLTPGSRQLSHSHWCSVSGRVPKLACVNIRNLLVADSHHPSFRRVSIQYLFSSRQSRSAGNLPTNNKRNSSIQEPFVFLPELLVTHEMKYEPGVDIGLTSSQSLKVACFICLKGFYGCQRILFRSLRNLFHLFFKR